MKIIAIDIGNTNVTFGIIDENKSHHIWRISSSADRMSDEYVVFLDYYFKKFQINISEITDTVICSVVPAIVPAISESIEKIINRKPIVIGKDIRADIHIDIKNPIELGIDRIVNSFAGFKLFHSPCIIVDFGTATTFDIVSATGHYSGGIICPGIKISLDALSRKTAQLPKISPVRPDSLIGKNTVESILSGSYYGYIYMIKGLIDHAKLEMNKNTTKEEIKVIATGGFSDELHSDIHKFDIIMPDLTMRGIYFVYNDHRKKLINK